MFYVCYTYFRFKYFIRNGSDLRFTRMFKPHGRIFTISPQAESKKISIVMILSSLKNHLFILRR